MENETGPMSGVAEEVTPMAPEKLEKLRKKGKSGRVVYRLKEGEVKRGDQVVGTGFKGHDGRIYLKEGSTWKRATPKVRMSKKERRKLREQQEAAGAGQ